MNHPPDQATDFLRRGRQRMALFKIPDRFTVRLNRGQHARRISDQYACRHQQQLYRQRLEEFSVDSALMDRVMEQVRSTREVAFASHVYHLAGEPESRVYLTDEITLQFSEQASQQQMEELVELHGLELVKALNEVTKAYVFRLTERARQNPLKLSDYLEGLDLVDLCEANIAVPSVHKYLPSDDQFQHQWHLHHEGGLHLAEGSHVEAAAAWDLHRGDRSVVVAITDDSVDLRHRDFEGIGKIVAPRDFMGRDFDPIPEASFDNHGTACAGVAVAEENAMGVVGMAPGCALMPVRTSGFLDDNAIEELFGWCHQQGASVISCSWGPAANHFPLSLRQDRALQEAATRGRNGKGCVIVFAAGNANRPVNGVVNEREWPDPTRNGPTTWLDGFVTHPDVIAVAACTSLNRKSAYSNWGEEISVCAPSSNGHPGLGNSFTYPRIRNTSFPGRGIVTTDRVGEVGYDRSDYTFTFGGTSSSCPLVAGVAALVLSANPQLTARDVRAVLEQTADKIEDPSTDPQLGHAYGTYDESGHSRWFGYGKVNAFRAVQRALELRGGGDGASEYSYTSRPALAIPDNDAKGVSDALVVEETGLLSAIEVDVNIPHSYIGDLVVTLLGPSGAYAILHNRAGGGADNLSRTYTLENTSSLGVFVKQPIKGSWRLEVMDRARADIGQLAEWSLRLRVKKDAVVRLGEAPGVTIPDNDPNGLVRSLQTESQGRVGEVEVAMDISHTYISDLVITLEAPSGRLATLHNRTGGAADNIARTYTRLEVPGFDAWKGQPMAGTWTLRVRDLAGADVGKLNRWDLTIVPEA